jgi:hypothetical protein
VLVEVLSLQCPKGFVMKPAMLVRDGTVVSDGDGAVVAMSQKLCAEASNACRGGTMVGDGRGAEVAMPQKPLDAASVASRDAKMVGDIGRAAFETQRWQERCCCVATMTRCRWNGTTPFNLRWETELRGCLREK